MANDSRAGEKLTVEFLIDLLAQGWSEQEVLENYPTITREDLLACLRYAGELLQEERVYPGVAIDIGMGKNSNGASAASLIGCSRP